MTSWPTMKELTTGIRMTASIADTECLRTWCWRGGGTADRYVLYVTTLSSDSIIERMNIGGKITTGQNRRYRTAPASLCLSYIPRGLVFEQGQFLRLTSRADGAGWKGGCSETKVELMV